MEDFVLVGDYAYTAVGTGGLNVLDVRDPAHPVPLGSCHTGTNGTWLELAVAGSFAYVGTNDWLEIIDVSDPHDPGAVGRYRTGAADLAVSGGYAYVALKGTGGLSIVDVRDPAHCVGVGRYSTPGSAEVGGVATSGRYAYLAYGSAGFHVLDVSNPANPVRVGGCDMMATEVAISGSYAYVTGRANDVTGLHVFDVSNPTECKRLGGRALYGAAEVDVADNRAFVTNYSVVEVIDVSDPLQPSLLGEWRGTYIYKATGRGNHLFTAENRGFRITDMNSTNWVSLALIQMDGNSQAVALSGDLAFLADGAAGLSVVDVHDPRRPVQIGGVDTGAADDLALSGDFAYIVHHHLSDGQPSASLQVVDVSDPTNCVVVGGCRVQSFLAYQLAVAGGYAYVAAGSAGLVAIDARNPAACSIVGGYKNPDRSATSVLVSQNYAYVGMGDIVVVDVHDPAKCVAVGRYSANGLSPLAISGNLLYAAALYGTVLDVIDVSNPAQPVRVGSYTTGRIHHLALAGNHAFLTWSGWIDRHWQRGVEVVDVKDPANCRRVARYRTSGDEGQYGVAVAATGVYLAGGEEGLIILPTLPDFQTTLRVEAIPGVPFTIETTASLADPVTWTPLLTTSSPSVPFYYTDFDVKQSEKPNKYYRVRQ